MKNFMISLSFVFFLSSTFVSAETISLPSSTMDIDSGSFWLRKWSMNDQKDKASLETITGYEQALLLTFSGADYTYLNQQAATQFKSLGNNVFEWSYEDNKVLYKRVYDIHDHVADISVFVQFKEKTPESAFLSVVSQAKSKNENESRYREVFYFTEGKIERNLVDSDLDSTSVATPVKWVGAGSHYFIFTVIPESTPQKVLLEKTSADNVQASMQFPVTNNQVSLKFKAAFVPKNLDLLRSIDKSLDTTVDLGFFAFLAYPILWTLKFIYKYVGNYGVAIILLTILIKLLTFPLVVKSMKSMRKMSDFQPKMKALQDKHKNDKQAFNQEMMKVMKESGYNPMAGCFPMLLQMPIFFALYQALDTAVELKHAPFIWWLQDLSAKDPYFITPVLMSLIMFYQTKLTPPSPGMDPAQQKMMKFMPLIFGAFMLTTPAGLCVYMLVNSIVSVIQQQYLNKKLGVPSATAGLATGF
jgi:YidC/Oxa1 family membrane protein insertase